MTKAGANVTDIAQRDAARSPPILHHAPLLFQQRLGATRAQPDETIVDHETAEEKHRPIKGETHP